MEKSPNKTNVEEIQPIFIAKRKTEENGSVSKSICTKAKQNKNKRQFQPKKKNHFIKRRK